MSRYQLRMQSGFWRGFALTLLFMTCLAFVYDHVGDEPATNQR